MQWLVSALGLAAHVLITLIVLLIGAVIGMIGLSLRHRQDEEKYRQVGDLTTAVQLQEQVQQAIQKAVPGFIQMTEMSYSREKVMDIIRRNYGHDGVNEP